jgi:hypothetical protein
VVYTYNGISLSLKKEEILTCVAMWEKLEDIMSDEINVSCPKTNTV